MITDIEKLQFIENELNRLTNYFNDGESKTQLPKEYFLQLFKALNILNDTAIELFNNISQSDNKEDHYNAKIILNRIHNIK